MGCVASHIQHAARDVKFLSYVNFVLKKISILRLQAIWARVVVLVLLVSQVRRRRAEQLGPCGRMKILILHLDVNVHETSKLSL